MEIWKEIEGYEGDYLVSNLGRIKSLKYKKHKILKNTIDAFGYNYVTLSKGNKTRKCKVHRLVAEAFIPNPKNKPQVNHLDENKSNNCVSNLEWCTPYENNVYGTHVQRCADGCSKAIYGVNVESGLIIFFKSSAEAGRSGFQQSLIADCLRGRQKTHKGYKWYRL